MPSLTLTPTLTATPAAAPTYNPGMAETFSWVPIEGAGRPLFAQASYLTNASDIQINLDSLSLGDLTVNTDDLEVISQRTNTLLTELTSSNKIVPGWAIPTYDQIDFEYVGSTDIFRKVIYKKSSTEVLSLSFTYVTEPPTVGNAIIQSVKKL